MPSSTEVTWLLELTLAPDADDTFTTLMEEMVTGTRESEPGTLIYEWSISADRRTVWILERYTDSDAVMTHMGTFGGRFAGRFLAILTPVRLVVTGSPDERVRKALEGLHPAWGGARGWFHALGRL